MIGDMMNMLRAARRGVLRVHIDIAELERFGERLDRAASRLGAGIDLAWPPLAGRLV